MFSFQYPDCLRLREKDDIKGGKRKSEKEEKNKVFYPANFFSGSDRKTIPILGGSVSSFPSINKDLQKNRCFFRGDNQVKTFTHFRTRSIERKREREKGEKK